MNNPPRILIVDDNEANRDILYARLRVHGYERMQAADGEEKVRRALHGYDLPNGANHPSVADDS